MRLTKEENPCGQGKGFQGKTINRPSKYGMLATNGNQPCFCQAIQSRGVFRLCCTRQRFDLCGGEVVLCRMFGYMGYAL